MLIVSTLKVICYFQNLWNISEDTFKIYETFERICTTFCLFPTRLILMILTMQCSWYTYLWYVHVLCSISVCSILVSPRHPHLSEESRLACTVKISSTHRLPWHSAHWTVLYNHAAQCSQCAMKTSCIQCRSCQCTAECLLHTVLYQKDWPIESLLLHSLSTGDYSRLPV